MVNKMDVFELIIVAVTPGIALCLALYLADHYEREPFKYLILVFFGGCLSTLPTFIFEYLFQFFNIFRGGLRILFISFIGVALVEEFFKRGVVLLTVYRHRVFNEKLDGIVYASFSALGFATIENILYVVLRFAHVPYVGIYRAFLSVPAHMLYAVIMGYYLSLAKFTDDELLRKKYMRKSLWVPVLMHGIFDFILMINVKGTTSILVFYIVSLWFISIQKIVKFYKESKMNFIQKND